MTRPYLDRPRDGPNLDRVFTVDLELLGVSEGRGRMIDVGCGAGRHELAASRRNTTTVAVDTSIADLRNGRYFASEDPQSAGGTSRLEWVCADGLRLPFACATFDAAICSETLEHLADDTAALMELRRVVATGGRCAFSVPAFAPEFALWMLSWQVTHTAGGHVRLYRKGELVERLKATGWRPYAIRRRHAFESVYWLLGAVTGGGDPPPAPARAWRRIVNAGGTAARPLDGIERALSGALAKSLVIYATAV